MTQRRGDRQRWCEDRGVRIAVRIRVRIAVRIEAGKDDQQQWCQGRG